MSSPRLALLVCLQVYSAFACVAAGTRDETEVCVLGMIHADHLSSKRWGLAQVRETLIRLKPDAVLAEIPPDRYPRAAQEFLQSGEIDEPRVSRFPEYTDVLFPLWRELGFEIVPCAAWTEPMARERSAKLARWRIVRPEDSEAVEAGMKWIERRLKDFGFPDDPLLIHTKTYDSIVEEGLEPYARLFNEGLGAGGWATINASHWALLEEAIDKRAGERLVITFGGWHKYWILEQLRLREDVVILDPRDYLPR